MNSMLKDTANAATPSDLSPAKRKLYEQLINRQYGSLSLTDGSPTRELTPDQLRLWLSTQLNHDSHMLHLASAYRVSSSLDVQQLQKSINHVVALQDQLRTEFVIDNGSPLMRIQQEAELQLRLISCEPDTLDAEIDAIGRKLFDLTRAPLARCALIRCDKHCYLVVVMHHLIADGLSQEIFIDQVVAHYRGESITVTSNFHGYQNWLEEQRRSAAWSNQIEFWRNTLTDVPEVLQLPGNEERPAEQSFQGQTLRFSVSADQYSDFKDALSQRGHGNFAGLLSIYALLLHHISGQDDFLIGVPMASRLHSSVQNIIGFFANTSLVRTNTLYCNDFHELITTVQKSIDACIDNNLVSFSDIVEMLNPERRGNYTPLVQVMFSFLPAQQARTLEGELIEEYPITSDTAEFDMFWVAREKSDGSLEFHVQYNTEIYNHQTIEAWFDVFHNIMSLTASNIGLSPSSVLSKVDQKTSNDKPPILPLYVCANFTADPVEPYIAYLLSQLDYRVDLQFSGYDQVLQELQFETSALRSSPHGGVIILSLEKWIGPNYESLISELLASLEAASAQGCVVGVISTKPSPDLAFKHILEIQRTEKHIANVADKNKFLFIPFNQLEAFSTVDDYFDPISFELGDMPYTAPYYALLAQSMAEIAFHRFFRPFKVIVLDCDNTLWGGACGDLGADKIELSDDFRAFQRKIISCQEAGALICLCSKNVPENVDSVFSENPEMVLLDHHIVAKKVNWEPKSANLIELSHELNLGLDSFLLIDDNPVEIAEVKSQCPDVTCLLFPDNKQDRLHFSNHNWLLNMRAESHEDTKRTNMYKKNIQRSIDQREATSFKDFIKSLNVLVTFTPLVESNLERASQLTYRTNQFNSTTVRRTQSDFSTLIKANNYHGFLVNVEDRYGSYGNAGLILIKEDSSSLTVDSFIMSCRVLGRSVENRIVHFIGELATRLNKEHVIFPVIATAKNEPVRRYLVELFDPEKDSDFTGERAYTIPSNRLTAIPTDFQTEYKKQDFSKPAPLTGVRLDTDKYQELLRVLGKPVAFLNAYRSATEKKNQESLNHSPEHLIPEPRIPDTASNTHTSNLPTAAIANVAEPPGSYLTHLVGNDAPTKLGCETLPEKNPGSRLTAKEAEDKILAAWRAVLSNPTISRNENFFEVGGTSVLMVQVNSELKRKYAIDVSLIDMFKHPTAGGLASMLANTTESVETEQTAGAHSRGQRQRELLKRNLTRKIK